MKFYSIQPQTLVMMALVISLNMYYLSGFGFANGIFSFDQFNYPLDPRIEFRISVYLLLWRSPLWVVKLLRVLIFWKNIIVPF